MPASSTIRSTGSARFAAESRSSARSATKTARGAWSTSPVRNHHSRTPCAPRTAALLGDDLSIVALVFDLPEPEVELLQWRLAVAADRVVAVLVGVDATADQRQQREDAQDEQHLARRRQFPRARHRSVAFRHAGSSDSGNERCTRGGTRKFWRCVVVSTELNPWPREPLANSSTRPSGSTPSIASRPRLKSSLVGLKTTKCRPAFAPGCIPSRSGCALQKNGLSSVLKSARCGIGVPRS